MVVLAFNLSTWEAKDYRNSEFEVYIVSSRTALGAT